MPHMLITGGCGFIGTHLAERFARCYRITLFDNLERDSFRYAPSLAKEPDVRVQQGDIRDRAAVDRAMAGADVVLHLAAIAGVSNYHTRPFDVLQVNILGTFNVLEAAVAAGVERLVDFSTSEVYGPDAVGVSEETAPMISGPVHERRWVYAVSKLASEHATLRYGEMHGLAATTVRPFNIYGPRQTGEGAISNFSRRLMRNEAIRIEGDGSDVRAWCYVSDLVDAVEAMIDRPEAAGRCFNIGAPMERCTTAELARHLMDLAGDGRIETVPQRHAPIRNRFPDIALAERVLGYRPKVGLRDGLRRTLDWFRETGA